MKKSNFRTSLSLILALMLVFAEFSSVYAAAPYDEEKTELPEEVKEEVPVKEITYMTAGSGHGENGHCICGNNSVAVGSEGASAHTAKHGAVTWNPVSTVAELTAAAAAGGNYYLTADITDTSTSSATVTFKAATNLCLNGYTWKKTGGARTFMLDKTSGPLSICDCKMKITSGEKNFPVYSGGQIIAYQSVNGVPLSGMLAQLSAEMNIFGGIFKGTTTSASGNYAGGIFYCTNGNLNLYNGCLQDGKAKTTNVTYAGGNIMIGSQTMNMYGGTVKNGEAVSGGNICSWGDGTFNMYGGYLLDGKAFGTPTDAAPNMGKGGNIYMTGTININGGVIYGGTATLGGSIYNSKKLTINGGEIIGGEATVETGGNVHATSNFIMTGGIIANGKCPRAKTGGNVNLSAASATRTFTGGIITGGSGEWGGNLYAGSAATMTLNGTDFGTEVVLSTGETAKGGTGGKGGNIYIPAGKTWTVTGKTEITNGIADGVGGGNIYAEGNLVLESGATVSNGSATSMTAGNACGGNIYLKTGKLTMADASVIGGKANKNGGNIYVLDAEVDMNGGLVKDGTSGSSLVSTYGGNFCYKLSTQRTHTISGVTFENGKNTAGSCGNVCFWATAAGLEFAVTECTFKEGSSTSAGGNFGMVDGSRATVTFTDCGFFDGYAKSGGGNIGITVAEDLIFDGCLFACGSAAKGGNIYFGTNGQTAVFKNGCIIKEGIALSGIGGNIDNETAAIDFGDSEIKDGVARANGGNIYTACDLTLEGTTITGGTSEASYGGSIFVTGATLTVNNGTLISGGKTLAGHLSDGSQVQCAGAYGGNIALSGEAVLRMNGGTIENGETNVSDYHIEDGKIDCTGTWGGASGGNIAVAGGCKMYMTGGIVRDGKAPGGGNIVAQGASPYIEISGGSILGGTATGDSYTHTGNGSEGKTVVTAIQDKTTEAVATKIETGYGANVLLSPTSGTNIFRITGGTFTNGTITDPDREELIGKKASCVFVNADGVISGGSFYKVGSSVKYPVITGGKFAVKPEHNLIGQSENSGCALQVIDLDSTETTEGMTLLYTIGEVAAVVAIGGDEYASFSMALEASGTGDTIVLLTDCEDTEAATLKKGAFLDLAGQTLTIPGLLVLGNIMDNGETKGSIVMDDPDNLSFGSDTDSGVLPVYENGAYQLYMPEILDDGTELSNIRFITNAGAGIHATKALYAFRPSGEDGSWEKVFSGSNLNLTLSPEGENEMTGEMTFIYGTEFTEQFIVNPAGYFTLRINAGISKLTALSALPFFEATNSNAIVNGDTKDADLELPE